ncbi:MAG: sensor histidine kinase [Saprospiraceae bacterium]
MEELRLTCTEAYEKYATNLMASIAIEANSPDGGYSSSLSAINTLLESDFLQDSANHPEHKLSVLDRKKNYLSNLGRVEEAIQLSHKILDVSKTTNDLKIVNNQLYFLANSHVKLRNIDSATFYSSIVDSMFTAAGTPGQSSRIYTTICYGANMGRSTTGHLDLCYKALQLAKLGNEREIAGALQALATVHSSGNRIDSASYYFDKTLAYMSRLNNPPIREARIRNSFATVLALDGNSDAALRQIDTISTIKVNNPGWPVPASNYAKAIAFDKKGNTKTAYDLISILLLEHESNPRIASPKAISGAQELMLRLSAKLGKAAPLPLIDTIFQQVENRLAEEQKSFSTSLDARFKKGKRTAEIASLKQIQDSQANALTNRNYALTGGALALFLLGSGGLALFRQRNNLSKANAKVNILNQELNHRSASQINLAYQLIRNQQLTLKDEQARGALAATEAQLLALKEVNKRLSTSGTDRVSVKEVLMKVAYNLQQASPNSFDLKIDIAPIELPADQVTKVALVVNELIINSMKYAFSDISNPNEVEGSVQLSLKSQGSTISLRYKDNGPGKDGKQRGTGLGTNLIAVLLEDLDAVIREPSEADGYAFEANWD